MSKTTNKLKLIRESGKGKFYNTGDDLIGVLQLTGSWKEMGKQYGNFLKDGMEKMWNMTLAPMFKEWTTEKEVLEQFGKRTLDTSSIRMKDFIRGIGEEIGWSPYKVSALSQSGLIKGYQAKLHSFSGCSSTLAWGDATTDGKMYTGRNLDWGELFLSLPLYLTVFNPNDGSNGVANLGWPGWLWIMSGLNNKGVYLDLHDGTSMGGGTVYMERASFLNSMFDILAECDDAEAVSRRFNSLRNDVSFIWTIADGSPNGFSFECPSYDNRRRNSNGDILVVVNTYMIDDWGIQKRETLSNSLKRYDNLTKRLEEAHGKIDADKTMEIFDLPLFNKDGSFAKKGGATKPTKQDADLTDHQIVTSPSELKVWLKIPLKTEWRYVDLKSLFNE